MSGNEEGVCSSSQASPIKQQTPSNPPCPSPAALCAPVWPVGWAGWHWGLCLRLLFVLPGPPCLCRRCWCWGRRCARCCPHPPPQSRFVWGQPGMSPASSPLHGPLPPMLPVLSQPREEGRATPGQGTAPVTPHHVLPPSPSSPAPSSSPWPPGGSHPPKPLTPLGQSLPWSGNWAAQDSLVRLTAPPSPQEVHHPGSSPSPFIHSAASSHHIQSAGESWPRKL